MTSKELNQEYANLMATLGQAAFHKSQLDEKLIELQNQINKLAATITEGHAKAIALQVKYNAALIEEATPAAIADIKEEV